MNMKSKLLLLFLALGFIQCSDFLEEQSQSEIRPSTVADMEKILETMAYPNNAVGTLLNRGTDIFTDNVKSNVVDEPSFVSRKEREFWRFIWDSQMFNEGGGGEDKSFWVSPYERIKGCNLILEYVDEMQGDAAKKGHMKGEAYALRGYYYFMLVNFFGLPYNYGNPEENVGVPLKLVTGVTDEKFIPNTVAECYDQIIKDLNTGIVLMKANQEKQSNLQWRMKYYSAYALLSRVYLYMDDWDRAIDYADTVLNERSGLLDFYNTPTSSTGVYHNNSPVEILWAVTEKGDANDWILLNPWTPSDDLSLVYVYDLDEGATDLRLRNGTLGFGRYDTWGNYPGVWMWVAKGQLMDQEYWLNGGIRTAELYLNRAEANIRKYMVSGDKSEAQSALDDLNTLRSNRFSSRVHKNKTLDAFADAEELLAFCLRERRRELCFEGNHRWFDLRRLGMPEIKHVFLDQDNGYGTEYVLQKEDPRYVLPIPDEVTKRNPNLKR